MDSERRTYGKRLDHTAMGWLASKDMSAYGLWMAWLYQPSQAIREQLKGLLTDEQRRTVAEAYKRSKLDG